MWSAFTSAALLALVACAGCGPRALDVTLTIDGSGCMLSVPAGGSVLYQVEANGASASVCGGCLAVDAAIGDATAMVAFLRTHAPSCSGVHPGDEACLLGQTHEGVRFDDAPDGMGPADERLDTGQPLRGHVDHRLVEDPHLVSGDGPVQRRLRAHYLRGARQGLRPHLRRLQHGARLRHLQAAHALRRGHAQRVLAMTVLAMTVLAMTVLATTVLAMTVLAT